MECSAESSMRYPQASVIDEEFIPRKYAELDTKGTSQSFNTEQDTTLPVEADFYLGHSTPPGYASWSNTCYGSWYICKLCEVLVEYAPHLDLLGMLTIVTYKVCNLATWQGYKQCPSPVSRLRKQVWFFKKHAIHH